MLAALYCTSPSPFTQCFGNPLLHAGLLRVRQVLGSFEVVDDVTRVVLEQGRRD